MYLNRSLLIHPGHRRGFNSVPSLSSRIEIFEDQEKLQYGVGCDLMYKLVCRTAQTAFSRCRLG